MHLVQRPPSSAATNVSKLIGSAAADGLARQFTTATTDVSSAIDQVLGVIVDTDAHDTLIGDLAFDQLMTGTHYRASQTQPPRTS